MHRRELLKTGAVALTAAATKPLFAWQGANNKIRMAVIGCGGRSGRVFDAFARRQSDVSWLAACEVNDQKMTGFMNPARQTFNMKRETDYRRILERNDIDAVLIGTPDFSHARIMVDAVNAGKDVYVEKPASNTVARINAMIDAQKKTGRIVQVGTQQRSWDYFQDAKKFMDTGVLGTVRQVLIMQPGAYASAKADPQPVPAGLDWDLWQLKGMPLGAPERPYAPNRTSFRSWYEYGSGLIGDWGAHHIDVAHWFMNADGKAPIRTAAVGHFMNVPSADPEMVPDTFSISWEYDTFMMSFSNAVIPRLKEDGEGWGVYFVGQAGTLHVNRMGWSVMPFVGTTRNIAPVPPAPTFNNVPLPAGAAAAAGAPAGGRAGGAPAGGRGGGGGATLERVTHLNPRGGVEEDYPLDVHVQNFIECVRSKKAPNASMDIGYSSALPALLALESLKMGKTLGWDASKRESKAL